MDRQLKQLTEFLGLICKLEPVEFVAICKILCVKIISDDSKTLRPAEDLIESVGIAFVHAGRKQRREILKLLRSVR